MEVIFIIIVIYVGGPIGLLMVLIGALGLWRGVDAVARRLAKLFLIFGGLLVIAAAWSFYVIAGVNFGL